MLRSLSIRNLATVQALDIDFDAGMSALTGETGAGKSVILGALGLTLGDRADKGVVRQGAAKAELSAEFSIADNARAQAWLQQQELFNEDDDSCLLRRVVGADGRSKGFINDAAVTMATLKALGEMLIDIHSQHEHQSLLQRATHLRLLDDFGVSAELLSELRSQFSQWRKIHEELNELRQQAAESSAESQLLSYQLEELQEIEPTSGEGSALQQEYQALNNVENNAEALGHALQIVSDGEEHNLQSDLSHALQLLQAMPGASESLRSTIELLASAQIQIQEANAELQALQQEFQADPERLEAINQRLASLQDLARKHRVEVDELPKRQEQLTAQLQRFENCDEEIARLQSEADRLLSSYQGIASKISKQRASAAKKLGKQVNEQLAALSMPHASLSVTLTSDGSDQPTRNGQESVEFLITTNPGQPPQALSKIASGGELSRISLAIQVITAQTSQTPVLVFDEVDVGIGGGVAKVVGELLRGLGQATQVICVTHQAQVAGQAHQHYVVSKAQGKSGMETEIQRLQTEAVVKEIARMLAGDKVSDESLAHASQLVAS